MKILRAVTFCAFTGLLYFGVPILGWGLDDLPGYFSNPARFGYAVLVGLFSLAVGIQAFDSTEGIRGRKGEAGKFVFRQRIVRVVLVLSLYIALFLIPFFDRYAIGVFNDGSLARWLGIVLSALGFSLVFWSGLALGRQYSADVTIQKEHHLITSGVYRLTRHPRYLGVITLSTGVSCVFRSWMDCLQACFSLLCLFFESGMRKRRCIRSLACSGKHIASTHGD